MKAIHQAILLMLVVGVITNPVLVMSQACPACSNPALQSSEKLEAGMDTLHKGAFRTTINATNGFNYQGGHDNQHGLSEQAERIEVPMHEHMVDLDFLRTEISLEYTFTTNWTIWLRVPYDIKQQTATVNFVEQVNVYEAEAILRNRDIHHRTETYQGISDLRILVARRINGFISGKGRLDAAFGVSLPSGKTEQNPLSAGLLGEKHLHIQFGSGTFDPLLEFHYVTGLSDRISLGMFSINKFPFYANTKGYLAAVETTSGVGVGLKVTDWFYIRTTLANFTQSQAKWSGTKDPNSGIFSFNSTANLSFKLNNGLTFTPGYRFPLSQQTFSDEGDTFTYGHTFVLNASYLFNK